MACWQSWCHLGLSRWHSACQCRRCKRRGFDPWVRKIPWGRKEQPAPVFFPGKFHRRRSLAGYSLWGCKESDTPEHIHTSCYLQLSPRVLGPHGCTHWMLADLCLLFLFSRVLRVWNLWQEVQILQLFPDPRPRTPRWVGVPGAEPRDPCLPIPCLLFPP